MEPPATGAQRDGLIARIEAAMDTFSPNDRRVADHLLSAYPDAAWETADEVASRVGVSKAAVIRFAGRLGYDGYAALQRLFQAELSERLASPLSLLERQTGSGGSNLLDLMLRQSTENLIRTHRRVSQETLEWAASRLAAPDAKVFVLGLRKSYGLATYVAQLLAMLRARVVLLPISDSAFPEALLDVAPGDVLLAITVRRYARRTLEAMDYCREVGASLIAVTDTLAGPATRRADAVFACAADGVSLFDSGISILFLLEILVNSVASKIREDAAARLRRGEELGSRFGVFEGSAATPRRRSRELGGG